MTDLASFEDIASHSVDLVGGKGLSLALLTRAGLPVPPGFCITSHAHRRLRGDGLTADSSLAHAIGTAYQQLGGGLVAVRSSATAEDGQITSFAGQQETILGVQGIDAVLAAVVRCWDSLDSERAHAYRRRQGVEEQFPAMAVVVQQLIPAEVAGVLFTRDPLDPTGEKMLVEASWGLGETVVSGQVTPDRFHLTRDKGTVVDRHISVKPTQRTVNGPEPVAPEKQKQACLSDEQLVQLADLGRQVEKFYGEPRDLEWAWADGRFWLLQARPITTADAAEREQVRREEIAQLQTLSDPAGTVWSRFNLSEILPEPTPMTWAIVRRFMSGRGGYGLMYRDLAFRPDPALDEIGVFDLICGRPYCNLSREPRLYSGWLPYEHPFARLKANPEKALYPMAVRNPAKVKPLTWLLLPLWMPVSIFQAMRQGMKLGTFSRSFPAEFRQKILPAFLSQTEREGKEDLTTLSSPALLERLESWIHRTLYDFARDSLKPTVLTAVAMTNVERWLRRKLGAERTRAALNELTMGIKPDPEADLPGAIQALSRGELDSATFLRRFGHRGPHEMELSQPRWSEDHQSVERMTRQVHARQPSPDEPTPNEWWGKVCREAKFTAFELVALKPEVQALQTHLSLRETAKHYLMHGYALIRRVLVELDRRHKLNGGIFYLTPEELPRLTAGEDLTKLIVQRRRRRTVALSLETPAVLFSDDLDAIGRAQTIAGMESMKGIPLSAGVAEAPALVLTEPQIDQIPAEPYILVCPSTDPAWVPLFVQARGLVMETGGVLSHGAIVAREFGLPAVAGLPDVVKRLRTGQRLRVDGANGTVSVLT